MSTSTLPTKHQNQPLVVQMLRDPKMHQQIVAALTGTGVDHRRFERVVMTYISQNNSAIMKLDSRQLLGCFVELAQLGLEPNTRLGHAYILTFGSKPQIIIGYPGLIVLAARAGFCIGADVVCHKDHFVYPRPGDAHIDHIPSEEDDRGSTRYAYAYAQKVNWPFQFVVLSASDIASRRRSSASVKANKSDSPWLSKDPVIVRAMEKKSAIRALVKFLPLSAEYQLARAVELDDMVESGVTQDFDFAEDVPADGDELRGRIDAAKAEKDGGQ